MYGHSGFATKAIYNEESRAKLLQQTEQVRAMHNWGCEDKAVTCQVLCGDFNLVDDEDLDVRKGARGKRHDEGMLAVALDNLGYDDAVRLRVGQEKRMHTYAKNGQVRSYLDRILVIGAEVTRAGILLPNKFRGLISCDHALVVADLDVTPLGKPNPEGELTNDRETQMKEVATILHDFMQGIYVLIISWTMKERHQVTATERPNGKDRSMNAELYAATLELDRSHRSQRRHRSRRAQ
jgi:hypothetical protein